MDCQLVNKKYRVCKQRDPTTSLHKQTNKQTNIELYTQADRSYTYNSMENSQINGFTQPAWGKKSNIMGSRRSKWVSLFTEYTQIRMSV